MNASTRRKPKNRSYSAEAFEPRLMLTGGIVGDVNHDRALNLADLDAIAAAVGTGDTVFDLTNDENVDSHDILRFLDVFGTVPGDANLDRRVDFADFSVLQDHFGQPSHWSSADFDQDGHTGFRDFLSLSHNFGFEADASHSISGRKLRGSTAPAPPNLFGPLPYRSSADNPLQFTADRELLNFEQGYLDFAGISIDGHRLTLTSETFPPHLFDSVDADDGIVDGVCADCDSLWAWGDPGITVSFAADELGGLPSSVGLVWTDGEGQTSFEAFDGSGESLGIVGPITLDDGVVTSSVTDDHFFGVAYEGGVSSIRIWNTQGGIEIDHLQFGSIVAPYQAVPLSGWSIYLDQNDNSRLDASEPISTTDASGRYAFHGLLPGLHVIREVPQDGWEQHFPGSSHDFAHYITLGDHREQSHVDFANEERDIPHPECLVHAGGLSTFVVDDADLVGPRTPTSTFAPSHASFIGRPKAGNSDQLIAGPLFANDDRRTDLAVLADGVLSIHTSDQHGNVDSVVPLAMDVSAFTVGDVSGSPHHDLVVGFSSGLLKILEGDGTGTFQENSTLAQQFGAGVLDITRGDFNADGLLDIGVLLQYEAALLLREPSSPVLPVIDNGGFANGLADWQFEAVGHSEGLSGSASAASGYLEMVENQSFLTTVHQTFMVPPDPDQLSVRILNASFGEVANQELPDAFELSLLGPDQESLLPSIAASATSLFNLGPDTAQAAAGVSWDGQTVTIDISSLVPGTQATLFLDLIGNGKDTTTRIIVDDVNVSPTPTTETTYRMRPIDDGTERARTIVACHANEDSLSDIRFDGIEGGRHVWLNEGSALSSPRRPNFHRQDQHTQRVARNERVDVFLPTSTHHAAYSFDAAAGQTIVFSMLEHTANLQATLASPSGTLLWQGPISDVATFSIFETGTHTWTLTGGNAGSGHATFVMHHRPAAAPSHIEVGQEVVGAITVPGEIDEFQFTGVAGQRLYFDNLGDSGGLDWKVIDPSGSEIARDFLFRDFGPVELPRSGEFTVEVSGRGSRVGDYRFQIVSVPPPSPRTIGLDVPIHGNIDVPGETDLYVFTGTAGQRLYFDAGETSASLLWRITSPSGLAIDDDGFYRDIGPILLAETGEFTLEVDGRIDSVGAYQFRIVDVPLPAPLAIDLNALVRGAIDVPGETDLYVFSATAGQRLYFDTDEASSRLEWSLTTPGGVEIADHTFFRDFGPIEITESGEFTVEIDGRGHNVAAYQFHIWDSTAHAEIISQDTFVSGVRAPYQDLSYSFHAEAGQRLMLDVIHNPAQVSAFTLLDPAGNTIFTDATADRYLPILNEGGIYTINVVREPSSRADSYGEFAFRMHRPFEPLNTGPRDSQGTDFWLAFPPATIQQNLSLYISAEQDTRVQVLIPGIEFVAVRDVKAGQLSVIEIPPDATLGGIRGADNDLVENKGVRISAEREITVYSMLDAQFTSDAYLGLPVDAVGKDYFILDYPASRIGLAGRPSQMAVVATQDGTTVTITPSVAAADHEPGIPFSITLDAGQTYLLKGGSTIGRTGLSGTHVSADKPISVFSGHPTAFIPASVSSGDHIIEQLPPTNAWGRDFVTTPLATRRGGDTFRFVASVDGTKVKVNGDTVATLDRGEVHELLIEGGAEINANEPILVAQFANSNDFDGITGDPFMMLITPHEQFRTEYTIGTPDVGFQSHFVNVIVDEHHTGSILLDGVSVDSAVFVPIGNGRFYGAQLSITPGEHRISSPSPMGVFVYGFGEDDSYGYPGGTALAPVALVTTLTTTPAIADVLLGSTHAVSTRVSDTHGAPLVGVRVDFDVVGANDHRGFALSDTNGVAVFTYVGDIAGTDTVQASVGPLTDSVIVDWIAAAPIVRITSPEIGSDVVSGKNTLITGQALPGPSQGSIVAVTINGTPVDTLDTAGNFFATVPVTLGANAFSVMAIDQFNQTAIASLQLVGLEESADVDELGLSDVTTLGTLDYRFITFNRAAHTVYADVRLTNPSSGAIAAPILAAYHPVRPVSIELVNPDGMLESGTPFVQFDAEIPSANLASGASSEPIRLAFTNPLRERPDLDVQLLNLGNTPPKFTTSPVATAVVDKDYVYEAAARDREQMVLEYALDETPSGMTIDPAKGTIRWTPTSSQLGAHQVAIRVNDGFGGSASQSFQLEARASIPNRSPRFTSAPVTQIDSGEDYVYRPSVFDPDGDVPVFSFEFAPNGAQIDQETGQVSLIAPADGTVEFHIRVEDGGGAFATQKFSVTVGSASSNDSIPRFVSTPISEATVDTLYVYFAQASDDDGDDVTLSLVGGPEGMVLDAPSGRIDFTPTESLLGPHAVLLTASDGNGGITSQSFVVEVSREAPNAPPTIHSVPSLIATRSEPYTYQVESRDSDGDIDLTYHVIDAPAGLSIGGETGEISWTPDETQIGLQPIEIRVSDAAGAAGYQRFAIDVRDTNVAPEFQTTPITLAEVGDEYRYDSLATDSEDDVTYRLVDGPFGMTVGSLNGIVFWKSDSNDVGNHPVTIRATDERGLSTDQSFEITVGADTQGPEVVVHLSNNLVDPGDRVRIDVAAYDSAGVASLELAIDGVSQTLDPNQGVFYSPTGFGLSAIVATAVDAYGNVGTDSKTLRVIDHSDSTPPEITISSPAPGAAINYLTDIVGSVIADDLEFYRVQVAPFDQVDLQNPMVDNAVWQTIAEGSSEADDELLANIDPTRIRNDSYAIRVLAQDVNGNIQVESQRIDVEGLAKIGEFSFEAVDLAVPLAGIPIEITRRYSSHDADISGDFGYGWSLGVATGDIRETVSAGSSSLSGWFTAEAFRVGTRVFLTNPEGQRVSFTFQPFATPGLLGSIWHPHFEPDPGVYDRLEVEDVGLQQREDGSFSLYLFGFNYNPDSYTLITPDQTRYTYDQFAETELTQINSRNGVTLSVSDDGIRSSTGEAITWKRDSLGRIDFITDPDGNEIHYDYTPSGDLRTVANQIGDVTTMGYLANPPHFLESVEDARGNQVLRLEYGDDGRLAAQLDVFGNASRLLHDIPEQRETIFDLAGNPTTLLYNDRGNVLEETDAFGHTIVREYNDPQNPDLETRIIDKRGYVTEQQFDERGNLLHIIDMGHMDAPFEEPIQTSFTYNLSNDVTSVTDGRKNTTVFRYDGMNLGEIENARGDVASFTYYANGDVESFTDFRDNTTEFKDYKSGQPRRIIFADGAEQRLDYNQFGQTTYEAFFEADGTLAQERRSEFDAAGRLIKEIAGSDADGSRTERRLFYENELLSWEIIVHPDSLGADGKLTESPATPVENRHSSITVYEYDAASRLIQQTDAEGGVIDFRYDAQGNRIALRDPVGNITTWLYDALNRPIEERDPLYWEAVRTSTPELEALTPDAFFELVAPNSPVSSTDPLYDDPSGASCETITGAKHVILTCFDAEGNQDMIIDRNGRRREFDYEFDGELSEERWYSLKGELIRTMSFGYDAARNMDFASDPDSTYVFTYDSLNQLDTVDNAGTPRVPNIVLDYQFDAQGNPESVSDNLGVTVASQYNDRNLLEHRQWFDASGNNAVSPLRVDFQYNAAGRMSDMFRYADLDANDLVGQVHRGYDLAGRSDAISFNDAVDRVLTAYEFGYDKLGRMDRDSRAGITSTYGYDFTGQLTSANRSSGNNESFSYDANGNRTLPGYMTGVGNRLETDGNFIYGYDGEGNRIAKTEIDTGKVTRYEFDHRNRMVRVTEQEVGSEEVELAAYTYDALNRRIIIDTSEGVTITVYDREQAWADFNEAGEVTTRYLYDDQIDFLLAIAESGEQPIFVNTDLLGSVVGYVSNDGALLSAIAYQAFGELVAGNLMGRFGFTGREHESTTDSYFYRARYFDPNIGYFASLDPLGFRAESNFYRYVENAPSELVDPFGEVSATTNGLVARLVIIRSEKSILATGINLVCRFQQVASLIASALFSLADIPLGRSQGIDTSELLKYFCAATAPRIGGTIRLPPITKRTGFRPPNGRPSNPGFQPKPGFPANNQIRPGTFSGRGGRGHRG